ncbi:MAG: 16S rRNA (guanine(966)-N(2))-methyltransferase RsmD [Coriobacteriia bacterium]|nr:16S rRNA (guanine(966)-N(2))-methyltransferase RsmD [Coriobacteriia bacterium]
MRVIAGRLRGRRLKAPKGNHTRPTTDRVRESLFSVLASLAGPEIGGGPCLDAFAGSGALGIEALSRGAGPTTFVETDRAALSVLDDNLDSLSLRGESRVLKGSVFSLAKCGIGGPFSLILLDPPYTLDAAQVRSLLSDLLSTGAVEPGALVSWEHASSTEVEWPEGFESVAQKRYGTIGISVARHMEGRGS